jgi:hypothetical protein
MSDKERRLTENYRHLHTLIRTATKGKRDHLEDVDACGRITVTRSERNRMGWHGLDSSGSGHGAVEGSCEHGNEPSGSIKCWETL